MTDSTFLTQPSGSHTAAAPGSSRASDSDSPEDDGLGPDSKDNAPAAHSPAEPHTHTRRGLVVAASVEVLAACTSAASVAP